MENLSSKGTSQSAASPTQNFVEIQEIKDGIVVLKNGTLRAILMVSSINFDLKSSTEQEAIISAYKGFLNSVDFPIQILVSSRRLDITPYLELLKEKEKMQPNDLLRFQISEYHNFIKKLVDVTNIMTKNFYIVVPFALTEGDKDGFLSKIKLALNPKQAMAEQQIKFQSYKNQLWQRVEHIAAGLEGTGIKIAPLNTEELIELFYSSYNPSIIEHPNAIRTDELDLSKV